LVQFPGPVDAGNKIDAINKDVDYLVAVPVVFESQPRATFLGKTDAI
jgi:hypothetical protein